MGGWDEEVFYALLQVGVLLEATGAPLADILDAYLQAHEARPRRAEALCALARLCRNAGRHAAAHLFAERAAALPQPDDVLFVDPSVYRWRARDELAIASWFVGHHAEGAALCRTLLDGDALPATERERVAANLRWCLGLVP